MKHIFSAIAVGANWFLGGYLLMYTVPDEQLTIAYLSTFVGLVLYQKIWRDARMGQITDGVLVHLLIFAPLVFAIVGLILWLGENFYQEAN